MTGEDPFLTIKTIITASTTTLFPMAGVIGKLESFFYDADTRKIYTAFATVFSAAVVLYCHSEGLNLINSHWWLGPLLAGICFLVYYGLLLKFRGNMPNGNGRKGSLLIGSCVLYIGLFAMLSYGFNTLGLLKFSRLSVRGAVFGSKAGKGARPLKDVHVMVLLMGEGKKLIARQMTDDQGRFQFFLTLSELSSVSRIEVSDPSGLYKGDTIDVPTQHLGEVIRDFALVRKDP